MGIPALPFSKLLKAIHKPLEKKLLPNPTTIGDKLKNRRLQLRLLQKDVASKIGVCEDSITLWENNRSEPSVNYYPRIIQFLEHIPFDVDASIPGGQIKLYRYLHGLTQEQLAQKLGINESTVYHYEKNKHMPCKKALKKLKFLL